MSYPADRFRPGDGYRENLRHIRMTADPALAHGRGRPI